MLVVGLLRRARDTREGRFALRLEGAIDDEARAAAPLVFAMVTVRLWGEHGQQLLIKE
jgi:hypothetical protein